ncbi:putative zinc finger protein 840 isoform X2 [Myzus persicae]|nr:putative zinc finger protein 840 isoform X2 [Myzus persicae]XP_022179750.1 putative zinc finger protein 840 isoform X2 [Myzus persicae]
MSKQLTKISPKKKLYTSSCDKYETIMAEDKIKVTKSNKDKSSAATSYVNSSENDKKLLKTQRKKIKKKKKKDSKVHHINSLKNDDTALLIDARHNQFKECFVLLSDINEHQKIHISHKASTNKSAKIGSENNEYSSIFTQVKTIKEINKKDSKVQNINNLRHDDAAVPTDARHYSQLKECFVLLSDFNKNEKIHIPLKASTSNSTKISSGNNNEYSSMVETKEQIIKKRKKGNVKAKKIKNYINDNAVVCTQKKHCNQLKECFVLLSDISEHKKNHKSHKSSTSGNITISSENDKEYSSILRTRGKNVKKINKYKVKKISNLENNNVAIHTEKRHCSKLNDSFVLLSDVSKHKKNHKPNKASTKNKSMIGSFGSENNKEYLSILETQDQNIKMILRSNVEKN